MQSNEKCKPIKLEYLPEELNIILLEAGLFSQDGNTKDTFIVLTHTDNDNKGFVYDKGIAKQRAILISRYLQQHKDTILPLVMAELGLMRKAISSYHEEQEND